MSQKEKILEPIRYNLKNQQVLKGWKPEGE